MSAIELHGVTKDYPTGFLHLRRVRALDGLSLTVERGEIFGFLGGNGAGKTTAIKILLRLIAPTAGHARILGHDAADVAVHARIGYLPEAPYFYDYLTARELLEYCAQLFGYAAFLDVGRVSGTDPRATPSLGTLYDVGMGLRLSSPRASGKSVVHIDLAFPLNGDPTIDKTQLIIETKGSF